MIEVDQLRKPCDSGDMELLRWEVGDATVFRIADVDATTALRADSQVQYGCCLPCGMADTHFC